MKDIKIHWNSRPVFKFPLFKKKNGRLIFLKKVITYKFVFHC